MGFFKEFKEFALKGNVIDLAVGVVIGAAFNKIVNSLVTDVILPPIGKLIGGVEFKDLKWIIQEAVMTDGKETKAAVAINYGNFIQTVFEFLIIALSVFVVIKIMNRAMNFRKKQEEVAPPTPPAPSNEEVLLGEIRDLLKNK